MKLTRTALNHVPVTLLITILIILLGMVSAVNLPIQMVPSIELPQIRVFAGRAGAAAEEIESVVIEPIENALKQVTGVEEIVSEINAGQGNIALTFSLGANMDTALLNVMTALNSVPPMPRDISGPLVLTSDSPRGGANSVATVQVRPQVPDSGIELYQYQNIVRDSVQHALRNLPGVAYVEWQNYRKTELLISFDPYKAAARGISVNQLTSLIQSAVDKSGGYSEVGDKRYTVKVEGQVTPDRFESLVVGNTAGIPIYLGDIASVEEKLRENRFFTMRNGMPSFYLSVVAQRGSNSVEVLDRINQTLNEINSTTLNPRGLMAEISFDASTHIRNALALVKGNLGIGLFLALAILLYFLRGARHTLLIAISVPLTLAVAIAMLHLLGRSLNVISMAGIAFSVGLVMDAAIIVQEAILRNVAKRGHSRQAILEACDKVGGAILSSTLTSVIIFVPILFMQGVEGQLFSDLAITMAVSVIASFFVAMTVIPLANFLLAHVKETKDPFYNRWRDLAQWLSRCVSSRNKALAWVVSTTVGALVAIAAIAPPLDFLPKAPTDGFFYVLILEPGSTEQQQQAELPEKLKMHLEPYLDEQLETGIKNYNFFVTHSGMGGGFMYANRSDKVEETMKAIEQNVLAKLPVAQFYMVRGSMINIMGGPSGSSVDLNIQGKDLNQLIDLSSLAKSHFNEEYPSIPIRTMPMVSKKQPTIAIQPDDRMLAANGLNRAQFGQIVDSYTDGMFAGEYFNGNERLRTELRIDAWDSIEGFKNLPVVTPHGDTVSMGSLASIEIVQRPAKLRRVDGWRTVTLSFIPNASMPLGELMNAINASVVPLLERNKPSDVRLTLSGNANKMEQATDTIFNNFLIALIILFLLMATYFRSLLDSLVVLSVIPVSVVGGLLALHGINLIDNQSLDLLTLIGFVILLGLVVNNAILLVGEIRAKQRIGLTKQDALVVALSIRLRAITISTLTSVVGMLPLVLIPGPGSEIYRGLAGVIVGGMVLSSFAALVILPAWLILLPSHSTNKRETHEQTTDHDIFNADTVATK